MRKIVVCLGVVVCLGLAQGWAQLDPTIPLRLRGVQVPSAAEQLLFSIVEARPSTSIRSPQQLCRLACHQFSFDHLVQYV
jgi:hypothetical protein